MDDSLKRLRFEPNDVLVLISDGLADEINEDGEYLGFKAVGNCIAENGRKSAKAIKNSLFALGEDWADGRPNEDAITVVVVKYLSKN